MVICFCRFFLNISLTCRAPALVDWEEVYHSSPCEVSLGIPLLSSPPPPFEEFYLQRPNIKVFMCRQSYHYPLCQHVSPPMDTVGMPKFWSCLLLLVDIACAGYKNTKIQKYKNTKKKQNKQNEKKANKKIENIKKKKNSFVGNVVSAVICGGWVRTKHKAQNFGVSISLKCLKHTRIRGAHHNWAMFVFHR